MSQPTQQQETEGTTEKKVKERTPLWRNYRVQWDFTGKLCGSVPQRADMIESWLNARQPSVRPPSSRSMSDVQEEVLSSLAVADDDEEVEERVTLGFQVHDGQLVMRGGTIRAHLKDCARILSSLWVGKIEKEKSFAVKVVNSLYIDEYWVPILRASGEAMHQSDGVFEKAVHVMTRQGQRNALKRIHYVMNARLVFTLKVMGGAVKPEDLSSLMQYGGVHGYAGERGDGEGRYLFTITQIE